MLWALPLCVAACVYVCVSLYPRHLPAVLLSVSTIWLLLLLKERERRRARKSRGGGGGGEKRKNFWGTSSLRLSSSLTHSLHLAFLFNTHFPSLLVPSLKFQSLCLLKIQASDVLRRLLTSSFLIREKPKQETHQHRFLCDLPRRRRPSLAPRTADCWAVTHRNKLIPDILTHVSVPAYTSNTWSMDMKIQEMKTTWYCTVIWAAISCMACGLICSQPSHFSKKLSWFLTYVLQILRSDHKVSSFGLPAFCGAKQMALDWTNIILARMAKSGCHANQLFCWFSFTKERRQENKDTGKLPQSVALNFWIRHFVPLSAEL